MACLDDAELRAFLAGGLAEDAIATVEAHLDGCAACRRAIAEHASQTVSDGGAADPSLQAIVRALIVAPTAEPGDEVAPPEILDEQYRIVRRLGRGGMGVVYLARDLRLERDVAIKLDSARSASGLKRAQREAIALGRLQHPNVVVVHQVGEVAGRLYIAMEYVASGNAREWLAARQRTWREIVALYAAAGDGLAAAHAAGFVHRDFKPDNVLVGDDGRPRVADFGLVRQGASSDDAAAGDAPRPAALERVTATGALVGTPAYMAPEQLAGGDVDARADQFAFCVAVWEALFAVRPPASEPVPPAPRARGVPRHVTAALRRGLARDRDLRWPSMARLIAALRADPAARRRRNAIAIGAITAALGGAIGVALATRVFEHRHDEAAAPLACAPLAPDARDVYVRAGASADRATGTAACPYRTITQALDARRDRGRPTTIHVAAGTYDAALGERFPLIVRGEVELAGAGADATHVIGRGAWDPRASALSVDPTVPVTLVAGDEHATQRIGGLAIASGAAGIEVGGFGVVCDRGDLGPVAREAPDRPPSLILHDVELGPTYGVAAVVTDTLGGTGCAMRLEHAFVHDSGTGVWALGCGMVPDDQGRAGVAVGLDIVDSRLIAIHTPPSRAVPEGQAVSVWDCTRWVGVRGTTIAQSDFGIEIVNHDKPTTQAIIEDDSFGDLSRAGVAIGRAARVDRLMRNTFANVSGGPARMIADRGVALLLDSNNERAAYPQVVLARGNAFMDNDVGVELRGAMPVAGVIDLGRPDDPGHNAIRCNATRDGSAIAGHDVVIRARLGPTAKVSFAGDTWDHAPPTTGASTNGADLDVPAGAAIDLRDAKAAKTACSVRAP